MTFEFHAHRPSAYSRFAILLIVLITINLVFIAFLFPLLKSMNDAAEKSIILVIPWMLLLLLPSVILGVIVYRSFVKTFRFTIEEKSLIVELLKKNKSATWEKKFDWKDLKNVRLIDFEDNHYCNLEFAEKKNNLVIHRESGEFEKFWKTLKEVAPEVTQRRNV